MTFSNQFLEAKHARREQRRAAFGQLSEVIQGSRAAQLMWALEPQSSQDQESGVPIGRQHPSIAASIALRTALADFALPVEYHVEYRGMRRFSGRGGHEIEDGEIDLGMSFRSLSGIDRVVDIPVRVINGHVLAPSVLVDRGVYRPITKDTFDDLIRQGTFMTEIPNRRTMFSPPPDERRPPKMVPLLRPGMFGVSPINKQLTAAYVRAAVRGAYPAEMLPFQAAQRVAYESQTPADASHLDVAERPTPSLCIGDACKLARAVAIVDRGSARYHLPKGEEGIIQRDMAGDGRAFYVFFDRIGMSAVVDAQDLA